MHIRSAGWLAFASPHPPCWQVCVFSYRSVLPIHCDWSLPCDYGLYNGDGESMPGDVGSAVVAPAASPPSFPLCAEKFQRTYRVNLQHTVKRTLGIDCGSCGGIGGPSDRGDPRGLVAWFLRPEKVGQEVTRRRPTTRPSTRRGGAKGCKNAREGKGREGKRGRGNSLHAEPYS